MSEYKKPVLACNLNALNNAERMQRNELIQQLRREVSEFTELDHGFAFRFPAELLPILSVVVQMERKCCSFLEFRFEPKDSGSIELSIFGPEGTKEFVLAELPELFPSKTKF